MNKVLDVQRWCRQCQRVFTATKTVEPQGRKETGTETSCPNCGTAEELLLSR